MELSKIKNLIEEVREWALKTGNTKNGMDYRKLFEVITGKRVTSQNWNNRMENNDYSLAAYAYGVYSFKGLNNWIEYKKRPNANKDFLSMLLKVK